MKKQTQKSQSINISSELCERIRKHLNPNGITIKWWCEDKLIAALEADEKLSKKKV